jgi:hypothetical protein
MSSQWSIGLASFAPGDDSMKFCSKSFIGPRLLAESSSCSAEHLRRPANIRHTRIGAMNFFTIKARASCVRSIPRGRRLRVVVGGHAHTVQGYERYKEVIFLRARQLFLPGLRDDSFGPAFTLNWPTRSRWSIVPLFHDPYRNAAAC